MSADGEDEVTAARGENHEGHSQIDQSRFSDIGRYELGGGLMAVRRSVRSPVAAAPRLNWSARTWLESSEGDGA